LKKLKNMIQQIKLFLLILSIVFLLNFIIKFILKFFEETPQPIEVTKTNEVFLYLGISYIITYCLI
jgi:hypothetical protein